VGQNGGMVTVRPAASWEERALEDAGGEPLIDRNEMGKGYGASVSV